MDIPLHVQAVLGVGTPTTDDDLLVAAEGTAYISDLFGLNGREFVDAVSPMGMQGVTFKTEPLQQSSTEWRVLDVSVPEGLARRAVMIPDAGATAPPSAAGEVLAQAWFAGQPVVEGGLLRPRLLVQAFRTGAEVEAFGAELVSTWCSLFPAGLGLIPLPLWILKNQILVVPTSKVVVSAKSRHYVRLFLEAVSETKAKWRFISCYRVLEHGYLDAVFDELSNSFFSAPAIAISAATRSLESELFQLIALVESASLQDLFQEFFDEFEKLRGSGNRFVHSLERAAQVMKETSNKKSWEQGVLFFYKTRCAIVHAGLGAPIFDAHPDAKDYLEQMLPVCERIVLSFLGIALS